MCIYINTKLKKLNNLKLIIWENSVSFMHSLPKSKIKFKIYMHTLNPFELRNWYLKLFNFLTILMKI